MHIFIASGIDFECGGSENQTSRLIFCFLYTLFVSSLFGILQFAREKDRELDESSRVVNAGKVSTYPMAQDNDQFFFGAEGYGPIFEEALAHAEDRRQQEQQQGAHGKRKKEALSPGQDPNSEILGFLGSLWRFFLRVFIFLTNDDINRLRMGRGGGGFESFIPYLTGHESYAVSQVVASFDLSHMEDDMNDNNQVLKLAFSNRNVSRALVQTFATRYDRLYHWCTQVSHNRVFDVLAQFPFLGFLGFPATENFPSSKFHAIRAMLRGIGEGSFITRLFTGNFQGLVTTNRKTEAQNLAAELTQFELSNRNQLSTHFGRIATNEFRAEHRLPTDESIVRTFATSPSSTMVNNGVEHVLRCLAKHWRNMIFQENGNFAHQRMEQLNPL